MLSDDDVFLWEDCWGFRHACTEYVEHVGQPDQVLLAESPEWVDFMENEA